MFAKIVLQNIKKSINDYLIYVITLIILSGLMFSANMFAEINSFSTNSESGSTANSLPMIIAITVIFLVSYINSFMIKRRSKEFAVYILSGINRWTIAIIFFSECLLIGLFSLCIGELFGLLLFYGISTILPSVLKFSFSFNVVVGSILTTVLYFSGIHILSILISCRKILKLKIRGLLSRQKYNEAGISRNRCITLFCIAIALFIFYIFQMKSIADISNTDNVLVVPFIFPTIVGILYCTYTGFYGFVQLFRNKHNKWFFKYNRLFITSQFLSNIKTNSRLTVILSSCLIIAIMACITGLIFIKYNGRIFNEQQDFAMGFVQVFIAGLFIVVIFTILALQQTVDLREHKYRFKILKDLGANENTISRIVLKQILIYFSIPMLVAFLLIICSLLPLDIQLYLLFNDRYIASKAFCVSCIFFLILYSCYLIVTYISIQKHILKKKSINLMN